MFRLEDGLIYKDEHFSKSGDFSQNIVRFCYKIGVPKELVEEIIENIEGHYREWKNPKVHKDGIQKIKNGVPQYRIINPSKKKLKWIQRRIVDRIFSKFIFPQNIQGGLKKRDNIQNASLHLGKKYHFCTDLSNFFPTVTSKLIYNRLCKIGFSSDVSRVITLLCTYKYRVPQGVSPSTYLTNLVLYPLDLKLITFCKEHSLTYSRFVDDIAISGNRDFKHLIPEVLACLKNSPFNISSPKTFYTIGVAEITGILVSNNVLNPKENIEAKLKNPELSEESKKALLHYRKRIKSV